MRKVELLAPAKDAEIGKEAINHGADAVYIGAPRFSARAAAGNDIRDIEALARYGHIFGAKTFVAFNTIMSDRELIDAEKMAWQLYEAGADALIIQDFGLLKLNLPPIELHASTQTDNRMVEKVRLMSQMGMTRVVVARELTVEQIRAIHEAVPDVELECFVHGALCVCVSGQCYLSAAMTGRSANRGECAQPCRLPMDLEDATGRVVARQKHLLSLKDMNRSARIEELIEAGVTSLKIEGRLKDMDYVKNVIAYYRQMIDRIMERHDDWQHVSVGEVRYGFEPALEKSFNRGFTDYQNDREAYWNFDTPKAIGQYVGTVDRVKGDRFTVKGDVALSNGDGLMVGAVGFRANRVEGNEVIPAKPEVLRDIRKGMDVWRNLDYRFQQMLNKPTARRKILVKMTLTVDDQYVTLRLDDGTTEISVRRGPFEAALKPQKDNYVKQLTKLGDTPFETDTCHVEGLSQLFVPSSVLADMRREAVASLMKKREEIDVQRRQSFVKPDYEALTRRLDARGIISEDFRANVMNEFAEEILQNMRLQNVDKAFEIEQDTQHPVMVTRHCLKYAFGHCPKHKNNTPEKDLANGDKWVEPMVLKIGGKKFLLKFGCKNDCMSEIFTIFAIPNYKK